MFEEHLIEAAAIKDIAANAIASNALLIEVLRGKARWICSVPLFLEYEDVTTRAEILLATRYKNVEIVKFLNDAATEIEPVE